MADSLKGKHILIIGVGLHGGGESAIRFCLKQHAILRVTDLKTKKQLPEIAKKFPHLKGTFGKHSKKDVDWANYCIKNPGVPTSAPILEYARKTHKPILSAIDLFLDHHKKRIDIAVTGTRGKSTTTALIAHIVKSKRKVFFAGNNRISVLDKAKIESGTVTIMELSSWQIEDTHHPLLAPRIGIFTNLYEDHLNRYNAMRSYFKAKARLFTLQSAKDTTIINYDQIQLRQFAKDLTTKIIFFSLHKLPRTLSGCFVYNNTIQLRLQKKLIPICKIKDLLVFGEHNLQNVCAAVCACASFGIPVRNIQKRLLSFKGLPGRLEIIQIKNGVTYINDTTSTSPDALRSAINALKYRYTNAKLHIIAGGSSKKLSYAQCAVFKKSTRIRFHLLSGTATPQLARLLSKKQISGTYLSLPTAFQAATASALPGDVIVLSPGAASFGMFLHEFDRGEKFNSLIHNLK